MLGEVIRLGSSLCKTSVAPLSFPPSTHSHGEVNSFDLVICVCPDLCLEKRAMKGRPPWGRGLWTTKGSNGGLMDQGKDKRESRGVYSGQSGYLYRDSTSQANSEGFDRTGCQLFL